MGESNGFVRFHGRGISQLSAEVLLGITHFLSMREVLVLGQVCPDLRGKLMVCGVITDIWNYLSLPKNKKRLVHRLVTGNRPLIDHLRNNPVGYSKSFPIQHSPAIFIKYASHFRERAVRASSATLVPSGCVDGAFDALFCELNYQHNCLVRRGFRRLHVWTNQKDGFWEKEQTIDYETLYCNTSQHATDTLFHGGKERGKYRISIIKRNEFGRWNVAQKHYLNDISQLLENHIICQMHLAENQQVLICEVRQEFKSAALIIFAMDDGRWRTKGRMHLCAPTDFLQAATNLQFRFGQDYGHVAALHGSVIHFMSRQDDGSWVETGKIETDDFLLDGKNFEFSTDDHHFVAWGQQYPCISRVAASGTGVQFDNGILRTDPFVLVGSLDDQGHWSEVLRIDRSCDRRIPISIPDAKFSPDGKQLFVCTNNELTILSLHKGGWVSSTHLLEPWDLSRFQIRTSMDPSSFMITSGITAWIYAIDASGIWGKQHEFSCSPKLSAKISSDGDTVICPHGEVRQIDIWSRRFPGQWIKQEIAIPATRVEFSPDGSLVALVSGCDLVFFGLTEKNQWQEKGRRKFDHRVDDLCFSPCGRSIRVDFQKGEGITITFWQIVLQ